MTAAATPFSPFLDRMLALRQNQDEHPLLPDLAAYAKDFLLKKGASSIKKQYRYFPLLNLFSRSFQVPGNEEAIPTMPLTAPRLVFIDGHFCPQWSDITLLEQEILVQPLSSAMKERASYFSRHYDKKKEEEKNPFAWLQWLISQNGAFLSVSSGVKCSHILHIYHISSKQNDAILAAPSLHVQVGENASLSLAMHHLSPKECPNWHAPYLSLDLQQGATLDLVEEQDLSCHCWATAFLRAELQSHACLNATFLTTGGKAIHRDWDIKLAGEQADANLHGLHKLGGHRQAHTTICVKHLVKNCRSSQIIKSALFDASRSSFEGKIYVHPQAQKTNAYQSSRHLLLGDNAMTYSQPMLEIYADDVKASHGATIGRLDSQSLFYLISRGIDKEEAKQLLVAGFCKEILSFIPHYNGHLLCPLIY